MVGWYFLLLFWPGSLVFFFFFLVALLLCAVPVTRRLLFQLVVVVLQQQQQQITLWRWFCGPLLPLDGRQEFSNDIINIVIIMTIIIGRRLSIIVIMNIVIMVFGWVKIYFENNCSKIIDPVLLIWNGNYNNIKRCVCRGLKTYYSKTELSCIHMQKTTV